MKKSDAVYAAVQTLYQDGSDPGMGKWMWDNHVQWVANKAKQLAEKYGASTEKVYCAALLHDLGDSRLKRSDKTFVAWSEEHGARILIDAGFEPDEAREIIEGVIRPHSCRPGHLPATLEGKVSATADAMWHLQTSFFPVLCYMRRPEHTHTYEQWQEWFTEKIGRDFEVKIFFADERSEVRADYEALVRVFGNKTLTSNQA